MRRAIYPGSFDPVTNGHLDIIERGCKLFDEIIISILINPEKQPFFTVDERREMLDDVIKSISKGRCTVRVAEETTTFALFLPGFRAATPALGVTPSELLRTS